MKLRFALLLIVAGIARADTGSIVTLPGGANGSIQVNKRGAFAGDSSLVYSTSTHILATPILSVSTVTINGITYSFPASNPVAGTFWRNDGAGGVTMAAPTSFAVSTGTPLAILRSGVVVTSPTLAINFGSNFTTTLNGSTTADLQLNPAVVTLLGPDIDLASEVSGSLPATSISSGSLGSNVIASSIGVNAVKDSAITSVSGSKVSGDISGNSVGITGSVNVSQVVGAVTVYPATGTPSMPLGLSVSTVSASTVTVNSSLAMVAGSSITNASSTQPLYMAIPNITVNNPLFKLTGVADSSGLSGISLGSNAIHFKNIGVGPSDTFTIDASTINPMMTYNADTVLCSDLSSNCRLTSVGLGLQGTSTGIGVIVDRTGKINTGGIKHKTALLAVGGSAVIGTGYSDVGTLPTNGVLVTGALYTGTTVPASTTQLSVIASTASTYMARFSTASVGGTEVIVSTDGAFAIRGPGDGQALFTIGSSTYAVASTSSTNTAFHMVGWSANNTLIDIGAPGSGGGSDNLGNHLATKLLTAGYGVVATSGVFTSTFAVSGTSITFNAPTTIYGTTWTSRGFYFDNEQSTMSVGYLKINGSYGTNGQVFTSAGVGARPTWTTPTTGSGGGDSFGSHIATQTVTANYGILASTAVLGSATSTTYGNASYMTINSSGSSQALIVNINGQPSAGVQTKVGGVTINALGPAGPPIDMLVLRSSYTSSQGGSAILGIWGENPLRNDPIFWLHDVSNNSAPDIRVDRPAPNEEIIATSTDNAHGLGKWEPYAIPFQDIILQINARSYDNTTFENVAFWNPLQAYDSNPYGPSGLFLRAQDPSNDPNVVSSDTSHIRFYTLNNHTIGLTAPRNVTSGSWSWRLPHTPNNLGNLIYQADNGDGTRLQSRTLEFTMGGSSGQVMTNGGSNSGNAPFWSTLPASDGTGYKLEPSTITPNLALGVQGTTATLTAFNSTLTSATVTGAGGLSTQYGITAGSVTATTFSFGASNDTTVVYSANAAMTRSSAFTFNGTTMAATTVSASTVTASQLMTASGPFGLKVNYGVTVGSVTGAGLSTCGDTTHSLGYSAGQFSCQTVGDGTAGPVSVSTGVLNNVNTFTGSVTLVSSNSIALFDATSGSLTVTVPLASGRAGQIFTISKVDATTNTVTIQASGSDVFNGTGTIRFNATTQTASIVSGGGTAWLPYGQGIQWTPDFIGPGFQSNTANTINSSSVPVCGSFTTQVPVAIDSVTVHIGTPSGVIDVGIYDNNGKRLGSSGSTSGYSVGRLNLPLTSVLQLPPGVYWECLVADNTTATFFSATATNQQFVGGRSCAQAVGNVPLPATLPFPCTNTTRVVNYDMWAHVVGGAL